MVRQHRRRIGHAVKAALFLDAVVAIDREQRGFGVFLSLRLDNVADVDQLAVPGLQGNQLGRGALVQIRHDAARHRRDDLLAQRRIGDDAVVDGVAAGLLVIGDELAKRHILLLDEALGPPHGRGGRRGVGDVGPGQCRSSGKTHRAAQQRAPGPLVHLGLLPSGSPSLRARLWCLFKTAERVQMRRVKPRRPAARRGARGQ